MRLILQKILLTVKIELGIEYHTKVFMLQCSCNFRPIEKDGWIDNCTFLLGKDNLNGLFVYVWIKLHLPPVCSVRDDIKISI